MSITILGIESSCDDTSSAVIRDGVLLSNVIAGQAVHELMVALCRSWHRALISKILYRSLPKLSNVPVLTKVKLMQ